MRIEPRPKSPGIALAVIATTLLVLIGLLALTQRQPPPPTIAEFAPQSVENITEAPDDQTSSSGTGSGVGGEGATPTPEPPLGIDPLPRARRCVGDPPRQTEDPHSPPCVPYWEGDNGGATSKGVTRDSIFVAAPGKPPSQDYQDLVRHFNTRYEFYGRTLQLRGYTPTGGNTDQDGVPGDPAAAEADAVAVDENLGGVFASLTSPDRSGSEPHFYDELARRKVISVANRPAPADEARYENFAPYQWSFMAGPDRMARNMGEWMCDMLAGRPAAYGGEGTAPPLGPSKRAFGLIYQRNPDGTTPNYKPLKDQLALCGESLLEELETTGDATTATALVVQMRDAGVTSVVCICHIMFYALALMSAANAQGWNPEWLLQSHYYQDFDFASGIMPKSQSVHAFGLTMRDKSNPKSDMPFCWAMRDVRAGHGCGTYTHNWERYNNILVLASGIQLAGPTLTPASMQRGLYNARFPNPGAQRGPYYQSFIGFGPMDHTAVDDAGMIWFSPSDPSNEETPRGTFCNAERGTRHGPGQWPVQEPHFFEQPCR